MVKEGDLTCCLCFAESRSSNLSHHYNTWKRECSGFQQAVHGLFGGDPDQEARRENQHLLSLCSFWLCGVGLYCCSHPYSWCLNICLEPDPGSQGTECFPAEPFCFLHPAQCHLGCVRRLRSARYIVCYRQHWWMFRSVLSCLEHFRTR